ncbi:MAG TPA: SDR family oxidoreductase, partial [Candidatus Poseidoniales archaeon]
MCHGFIGNTQRLGGRLCTCSPRRFSMLGLEGKTAFVFGVASEDSIAWAICKQLAAAGATLYLGYQKRFMSRVFKLKDQLPAIAGFYPLDVASDATTKEFFTAFAAENPGLKADV